MTFDWYDETDQWFSHIWCCRCWHWIVSYLLHHPVQCCQPQILAGTCPSWIDSCEKYLKLRWLGRHRIGQLLAQPSSCGC